MSATTEATTMAASRAATKSDPAIGRLMDVMRRWFETMRERRARRAAQYHLGQLDDRLLKDIGIDRTEIDSVLTDTTGERRHGPHVR
jgi:uncharacterized protein YjiS (DUF1127 family)